MSETNFINLSQLIGGAVTSLLGGVIGYFSADRLAKRTAFRTASGIFRAAFIKELAALKDSTFDVNIPGHTHRLLLNAFSRHSEAVAAFQFHIPDDKIDAFNKAWVEYQASEEFNRSANRLRDLEDEPLAQYISKGTEEENRKLAIKNIQSLLNFDKA